MQSMLVFIKAYLHDVRRKVMANQQIMKEEVLAEIRNVRDMSEDMHESIDGFKSEGGLVKSGSDEEDVPKVPSVRDLKWLQGEWQSLSERLDTVLRAKQEIIPGTNGSKGLSRKKTGDMQTS